MVLREYVCERLVGYFPRLVSCNRFVELMGYSALPLAVYTRMFRQGRCQLTVSYRINRLFGESVITGFYRRGSDFIIELTLYTIGYEASGWGRMAIAANRGLTSAQIV